MLDHAKQVDSEYNIQDISQKMKKNNKINSLVYKGDSKLLNDLFS